jgi:hypothetical protein
MNRTTILSLLAVVAVVVGVPVGIVGLAGGGDDDEPGASAPAGQTFPEGIDADNAPEQQRDAGEREQEQRAGRARGGGPPQHAKAFDKTMAGVAYPAEITRDGAQAVVAVERAAGAEVAAGQQTVIGADCKKGVCHVRYRSGPRGTGLILATQARILRRLFANPDVRRVVLYVHHKTTGRKKEERPAFIVVDCRRSAGVAWSRLKAKHVARRCKLIDQAGGRLRSQVRRGNVSVEEASRGRGGDRGGHAGSSSGAGRGLDPVGTPAPENVNPKRPRRGERDAEPGGG